MTSAPLTINADEVNCLIYAYLQDSGFRHSAFNLRNEGRLDHSTHFHKHIPRGELVELLIKAMLYMEVEAHWRGSELTTNCTAGFSLLETHVCALTPPKTLSAFHPPSTLGSGTTALDILQKRKASTPVTEDGRSDKRLKTDTEADNSLAEQTPDPSVKPRKDGARESQSDITNDATLYGSKKPRRPTSPRPDDETDPNAIRLLLGHKSEVFVCAWNPAHSGLLATGSKDSVVNLWNIPPPSEEGIGQSFIEPPKTLDLMPSPKDDADLTSLHWNPDGSLLSVGSYDAKLRVFMPSGELYMTNPIHEGPVFATRFSPSGKWLLTASLDNSVCVWDIKGKKLHMQAKATECILDVDWLDDDTYAFGGGEKMVDIMTVDRETPLTYFCGHEKEINQVKFNPSGTRLASCSDDFTARLWNTREIDRSSPRPVYVSNAIVLEGHTNNVASVRWCPHTSKQDPEIIATSSFDHTARLWDADTGACLKAFTCHKRPIYTLTFSPNGLFLATGSGDGWLYVYDVQEREKVWSWHSEPTKRAVFELDWQQSEGIDRIAMALQSRKVGVIDVTRIPALQKKMLS